MKTKLIIAGIILVPVLAHVGYAFADSSLTNYYVTVDQYTALPVSSSVRVAGQVVPGSIQWDNATGTMHFEIAGDQKRLYIVFRGPVPDSFRDGVTAILEGGRSQDGTFVARSIAVKCPHQYLPSG